MKEMIAYCGLDCEKCDDGVKTVFCKTMCHIRQCALQKEVNTCGDYFKFDNCSIVGAIVENNPFALKKLKG